MRRRGNGIGRVLAFTLLLVIVGLNTPGLLSQSQIESPEAPRVTYVLLPKTRCVIAPPALPAENCPPGTLPPTETSINWIAADGSDFEGAVGYRDINKDIIKVTFRVIEATEVKDAPPGTFRAGQIFSFEPPAQTSDTGEFGFRIFTTVPQDVTLEVTLEDAKKNVSQPKIFSFKAVGPEPIISKIISPTEIPLGAEQKVLVGFIDREGQLSHVFFKLMNFDPKRVGDCALPNPNGVDVSEQVLGEKEGQLSFPISCNSAQRLILRVVLVDRQGNSSEQSVLRQNDIFEFIAGRKVADGLFFLDQFGQDGSELGAFRRPQGIAVDSKGNIYVADTENHRIQRFDPATFKLNEKLPSFVWGSQCLLRTGDGCRDPDGGGPLVPGDGQFNGPTDVVVDATGNVYVVDSGNHRIQKFDSNGKFLSKWGTRGSGPGQFETPISIALDSTGKFAYVADKGNHRIQKFDVSRSPVQFVAQWGSECNLTVTPPTGRCVDPDGAGPRQVGDGQFFEPQAVAVDRAGNVYVSDTGNHRIQKFRETGEFLLKWGRNGLNAGQFDIPRGLAFTSQDILLVVDQNNHRVQEFDSEGKFVRHWGVQGTGEGEFNAPQDIAIDSAGNIYIVELLNNRVQKLGDLK
ncbi:MAG: 6-bladed beta-propeller [Candidatus Bipolaricaulia bacterium]